MTETGRKDGDLAAARFAAARAGVPPFVAATFSPAGSARLHARAFGWDLLRAPVNVALAPFNVTVRLVALLARLARARRLADRLDRVSLVLTTDVAREIEERVASDLLGLPSPGAPLARRLAEAPAFRRVLRGAGSADEVARRTGRAAAAITAYSGTRSAVAEMTTAILALLAGGLLFQSLTPGMVSMAPTVADLLAHESAVESFPLGSGAGELWYGVFPVGATAWETGLTVAALILAASCVTAFAGLLADPVQARLGIHRRRLLRLLDAVEADLRGDAPRPFAAREHYYARLLDVIDAGSGLFRLFR